MSNQRQRNPAEHTYIVCDLESDLAKIVKGQLDENGILYNAKMSIEDLVARCLEITNRRIPATPRTVFFSEEAHESLSSLKRKHAKKGSEDAIEAWRTVFHIGRLLNEGKRVTPFLTKNVTRLTSRDGLLWDFGMHHFHLARRMEKEGFVERSSYLLYAIITGERAFFVDIRPHPERGGLGWSRHDLLDIVRKNWPDLLEARVVRGVEGEVLTDREVMNLRNKNVNYVAREGGKAVAAIGGGTMADGSSAICRWTAMKLLHNVRWHQSYFDGQPAELRSVLESMGVNVADGVECELVLPDVGTPTSDVLDALHDEPGMSGELARMGFVVVEASKKAPIIVSCDTDPGTPEPQRPTRR